MNTTRWFPLLPAVAVLLGFGPLSADDDVCLSPEFRSRFLEGQRGIVIDFTSPSPGLIAMGNRALPCLIRIAEHGGEDLNIDKCIDGPHGCEGWAMTAIRMIGTTEAREFLVGNLDAGKERYLLRIAIREVGILRNPDARKGLRELLQHPDAVIRVESLVSLAAIGDRSDYDVILETALALPDDQQRAATNGLRIFGDARSLEPLEERLAAIDSSEIRSGAEYVLKDWRNQIVEEQRLLDTLRTASGANLYKAIRGVQRPSGDVQKELEELLEDADPRVRAESVRALTGGTDAPGLERLLEVTLGLPEEYVLIGAQGLEILNDPRAILPLEDYAAEMTNARRRRELTAIVDRIRKHTAPQAEALANQPGVEM